MSGFAPRIVGLVTRICSAYDALFESFSLLQKSHYNARRPAMPPETRQVDVQQERGERRNPTPTRGATPQELATAAGAGDLKLTEPKLLPDEEELRRMIDLIPQTILVLNPDGKAIYANRVALEYTGLSLDEVRADNSRLLLFHPEVAERLGDERLRAFSGSVPLEDEHP